MTCKVVQSIVQEARCCAQFGDTAFVFPESKVGCTIMVNNLTKHAVGNGYSPNLAKLKHCYVVLKQRNENKHLQAS